MLAGYLITGAYAFLAEDAVVPLQIKTRRMLNTAAGYPSVAKYAGCPPDIGRGSLELTVLVFHTTKAIGGMFG
jgi:hypothetical protein